jgi:hypothetical protein
MLSLIISNYYLSPFRLLGIDLMIYKNAVKKRDKRPPGLKIVFFLALLLACCKTMQGKAILFDGRDGLGSSTITAIVKDGSGLMWIGTQKGLNIYDGYTFTKIQGILSSLPVTALAYNKAANELYAGTSQGMYSINLKTFQTRKCGPVTGSTAYWTTLPVTAICVNPYRKDSSSVYASFGKGIIAAGNSRNELNIICRLDDTSKTIKNILSRDDGSLLINNGELFLLDIATKRATIIQALKNLAPLNAISIQGETLTLNGYYSRLTLWDKHTFKSKQLPFFKDGSKAFPRQVLQSYMKDNLLYVLCDNYTFLMMDTRDGSSKEISKKYPDIFEGKVYNSIFTDEHDIVWIATNKGLIKVEERPELFKKMLYNLPSRVSTRKMVEDERGEIYVSSYVGLYQYLKETGEWKKYDRNTEAFNAGNPLAFRESVQPLAILPDAGSSYMYVGFDHEDLIRFDRKKKTFEQIPYRKELNGEKIKGIYCISRDSKGVLWLGCGNGLASYNTQENKLTLHKKNAFDIGNCRVRYIVMDKNNTQLYVATTQGLFIIDINKGITQHFNQVSKPALSNDDVLFADIDKDNNLWLGTNGGGINILSRDRKTIRQIRKQQGLSSEIVYSIIPQDENTLWIGTFNGMDRYRKDVHSFSNFFEEDGLSSNEFNQNSFLKTKDGQFLFGSINGITSFYPEQFGMPTPFHIFLSGVSKWDDKTQSLQLIRGSQHTDKTLEKRPSDLLLELHFGCTDYSDPLRNSYNYRIRELSDSWISLEDRHTLNLGGIPYGHYTVEVKAVNARGASSENMLVFHVKVSQPFYKTWWFYSLIMLGVAIIFYSAYLLKYQSFKNILQLRMRIASNLHDEVGSLLTRITMFSDNLRYGNNSEEQRNGKLEKIAVLSRNAIASMSDVLWTIDSRNDFAGNLLDRMREHAEEMLNPLGIDINFVISFTDLKQPITSDTRGEIYLIFKEAINNIARHSQATRVDITYQINDKYFLLKIMNNGAKDIAEETPSTGQGLSNMKMRAAKIDATITFHREDEYFSIEIKN